jgi:hypothetical protein
LSLGSVSEIIVWAFLDAGAVIIIPGSFLGVIGIAITSMGLGNAFFGDGGITLEMFWALGVMALTIWGIELLSGTSMGFT